jgi:hypothetical protein
VLLKVAKEFAAKGISVLISDLTHILRITDIVLAVDPEAPLLIECKKSGPREVEQLRRRARRQYSRMKGTIDYLRAGRAKVFGDPYERFAVESTIVPAFNWEIVAEVCSIAMLDGFASRLLSPYEIISAVRKGTEFPIPEGMRTGEFDARGLVLAAHHRPIDEAWSSVPPPLIWDVPREIQLQLLERDLDLVHFFNPSALVGRSFQEASITGIEPNDQLGGHAYAIKVGDHTGLISLNFTVEVAYGYRTVDNMAEGLLEFAILSENLIPAMNDDLAHTQMSDGA